MKSFGIDRIQNLQIHKDRPFVRDESIDVKSLFRDCYGIWNNPEDPARRNGTFLRCT